MLPVAFLDSDKQGAQFAKDLRANLYQTAQERVLQVGEYIEIEGAEVEDLIPPEIIIKAVGRMIREPEAAFEDHYESGRPIIPQIEAWANDSGTTLEKGWKVELAKRVKRTLLDGSDVPSGILNMWMRLFKDFQVGESDAVN